VERISGIIARGVQLLTNRRYGFPYWMVETKPYGSLRSFPTVEHPPKVSSSMWEEIILFACIGFVAQAIDGALGMAYGVTATTMLLSLGVAPPVASASVHTAEVFTTGVSGAAHWRLGNVDLTVARWLALAGIAGGATGAYLSTALPGSVMRPFVSVYLLAMGIVIVWRAIRRFGSDRGSAASSSTPTRVVPLGVIGGLLDAIGGGGWGATVTSTLIGWGMVPRLAIGSANLAEFFVTIVVMATFFATIGLELWPIIAGLVAGGVLAAPFAAFMTRKLPERPLMLLIGTVIALLSLRGLLASLH
jgi:uncharacterized membrane protein YfcA